MVRCGEMGRCGWSVTKICRYMVTGAAPAFQVSGSPHSSGRHISDGAQRGVRGRVLTDDLSSSDKDPAATGCHSKLPKVAHYQLSGGSGKEALVVLYIHPHLPTSGQIHANV